MAEFVQRALERMTEELATMKRLKLFSETEIKEILRRRQEHEYKLRRQRLDKAGLLSYVEYEMSVLALVRRRRRRFGVIAKKPETDYKIQDRIHALFGLGCTRFPEDYKLWLSHIDFAKKTHQYALCSKLYTKMLRRHSHVPDLWISAAKYKIECLDEMGEARRTFIKALRHHPVSKELWLAYFRFELEFSLNIRRANGQGYAEKLELAEFCRDSTLDEHGQVLNSCRLACTVFDNAVEAFSDDISFLLEFAVVSSEYDELFVPMSLYIRQKLKTVFNEDNPLIEIADGRYFLLKTHLISAISKRLRRGQKRKSPTVQAVNDLEKKCFDHFSAAVSAAGRQVDSYKQLYEAFLSCMLECARLKVPKACRISRRNRFISACQVALEAGFLSDPYLVEYLKRSQPVWTAETAETVKRYLMPDGQVKTGCSPVWPFYFKVSASVQSDVERIFTEFERFVVDHKMFRSTAKDDIDTWVCVVQALTGNGSLIRRLLDLLQRSVSSGPSYCCVCEAVLTCLCPEDEENATGNDRAGVDGFETVVRSVFSRSPISYNMLKTAATVLLKPTINRVETTRWTFERTGREIGHSCVDFWLDYIRFERLHGDAHRSGVIYARAARELTSEHIVKFQEQFLIGIQTAPTVVIREVDKTDSE